MISMLSCENTWPHGGLRSPWLPWDMGKGTWAPWAGPGPGPRGQLQGPGPAAAPWAQAWSGPWGPCDLALGPCPKGSKDSLGPHVGMYFHKKVWKSYQMYRRSVLLCEVPNCSLDV